MRFSDPCKLRGQGRKVRGTEGISSRRASPIVWWGRRLGRPLYTMAWPAALSIDGPRLPLRRSRFPHTHTLRNGSTFMLFMGTFHACICIICIFLSFFFSISQRFLFLGRRDIKKNCISFPISFISNTFIHICVVLKSFFFFVFCPVIISWYMSIGWCVQCFVNIRC